MPATVILLPDKARLLLPDVAVDLIDEHAPVSAETYTTVSYEGYNGGVLGTGLSVEVDEDSWVENDLFYFQEVSETTDSVILFDASRNVTVTIDYNTNDLIVSWNGGQLTWDVTGVTESAFPVIPDGWLI